MLKTKHRDYCHIDPSSPPVLIVVVDTEEQFDWSSTFSRSAVSVGHMRSIYKVQQIFDQYQIIPTYVVDYPVATQPDGYLPLKEILADGHCLIGAHVHPWVTPPYDEALNRKNSFPGNLPSALEAVKLKNLSACIEDNLGIRPVIHKAGRYGIGPNTFEILEDQGFEIDTSFCPHTSYVKEGGPDFTNDTAWPFWFGKKRRLLEMPLTTGFEGKLRRLGPHIYRVVTGRLLNYIHLPGILARLGLLNRVWLSPEGYSVSEQIRLVRALYADGLRIFCFSFHSPSVEPGNTPYVQSRQQLDRFLSRIREFFDFFTGEFKGKPSTSIQVRDSLLAAQQAGALEGQ